MTNHDLRAALAELGLTRARFAKLCGTDTGTVFRWLRDEDKPGALPVPGYAETIVRLMRKERDRALPARHPHLS